MYRDYRLCMKFIRVDFLVIELIIARRILYFHCTRPKDIQIGQFRAKINC